LRKRCRIDDDDGRWYFWRERLVATAEGRCRIANTAAPLIDILSWLTPRTTPIGTPNVAPDSYRRRCIIHYTTERILCVRRSVGQSKRIPSQRCRLPIAHFLPSEFCSSWRAYFLLNLRTFFRIFSRRQVSAYLCPWPFHYVHD